MTEHQNSSAGSAVLIEDIAKTIWLAEYRRATGKERSITWYDVAEDDRLKYLFVADAIVGVIPAPAQGWQLPKPLPLEGFASQPSPAATVETNPLYDSRNPNHGRTGGLRDTAAYSDINDAAHADPGPHERSSADNWDEEGKRIEKDFYAKVGRYCTFGPPAERKRQWIILFEDADKGVMVFENEREAHTAWDRAKDNWTCTLYETAHRKFVFAAGQLRPINEPQAAPVTDKALGELLAKICSHEAVDEAMQDAWNDICSDTGCHPLDVEHGKGKNLTFSPSHWANQVAKRLFVRALKLRLETSSQVSRPVRGSDNG